MAQDLLRLVRGDRLGLIAFAGSAFLQAPLTLDYSAVLASLDELDTAVIPKGGTNIAEAIRMAEQAFGKGEGTREPMIILTRRGGTGCRRSLRGEAGRSARSKRSSRWESVPREGSLIPLRTEGGGTDFVRDSRRQARPKSAG